MYIREDTLLSRRSSVSHGHCIKPCGCPRHKQTNKHNVISKIKQNSSDMNEIILAPCDAGYVQSCTGYLQSELIKSKLTKNNVDMLFSTIFYLIAPYPQVREFNPCSRFYGSTYMLK
jgi:hypothetical protein